MPTVDSISQRLWNAALLVDSDDLAEALAEESERLRTLGQGERQVDLRTGDDGTAAIIDPATGEVVFLFDRTAQVGTVLRPGPGGEG